MKRLEELCAAQNERLKKVEEMLTELHATVAFSPSVVLRAPKQKGTKRRTADKEKDEATMVALEMEQAVDAATETEEASNASATSEEAPKKARTELEDEADASISSKEVADAAIKTEEGASVNTETEEAEDPDTKTEEATPTPDVESIPEGSFNVNKGPHAPEEDKVPSETADEQLQVVETMAQLSTDMI